VIEMDHCQLIYEGSVKSVLSVENKPFYLFKYSDAFSVFDWGKMPDTIDDKGRALALIGNIFFKLLGDPVRWQQWPLIQNIRNVQNIKNVQGYAEIEKSEIYREFATLGVAHHCYGMGAQDDLLMVKKIEVMRPAAIWHHGKICWDYSAYKKSLRNTLIPLEIIFRFSLPPGSSLFSRLGDGRYCRELGIEIDKKLPEKFNIPLIEFSSKLETTDRYLSYAQAQEMAGMSDLEFAKLKESVSLIALRLKDLLAECEVELCDGKLEMCWGEDLKADGTRELILVDSIGPDELRLLYQGAQLTKEKMREFYRDSAWYVAVAEAKILGKEEGIENWQRICEERLGQSPPRIWPDKLKIFSSMYRAFANHLGEHFFKERYFYDCDNLSVVAEKLR